MKSDAPSPRRLLDPELLSRIGSLDVIARRVVEGTMVGMHESRSHGVGSEFAQYRPYIPGDDLRSLDWRVFARTDRYYVRQYTAETNLHAWLLVDSSASMGFQSRSVSKLDVSRILAASLAYLLVQQGDRVGLRPLAGATPTDVLPPGGGERHLHVLLHALDRMRAAGSGSLVAALDEALLRIRRRGPLVIFSDLYEPADKLGDAISRFSRAGFEVALFHVLDPIERNLELSGDIEFVGLEGDGRLTADPRRIRADYNSRFAAHVDALRRACNRSGADYVAIDTSGALDEALARYLRARRARVVAE